MKKIAIVTSGSCSLGKDMTLSLSRKNMNLIVTYNVNKEMAGNTVKEIESIGGKAFALQLKMSNFTYLDHFVT